MVWFEGCWKSTCLNSLPGVLVLIAKIWSLALDSSTLWMQTFLAETAYAIILDGLTSLICIWSFPSSQPGRLTTWEHLTLRGEEETELEGKRDKQGSWKAELGLQPQTHRATSAPPESELRTSQHPDWPEAKIGLSAINTQGQVTQQNKGNCHTVDVCRGHWGGCPWVAPEPSSGISIPAWWGRGSPVFPGQFQHSSFVHVLQWCW